DAWCEIPRSETPQYLDLRNNGELASGLPPELLESTDAQAILAAYRRYREAGRRKTLRPLNEAKLVVVGNEAVGKTSLIRYLVHGQPRDPDERKTPGTAIHEKIEVSTWSPHQSQVRLNVWDFGGQEIMRGTFRFFLTERSLYLLVLEDRREDDRSIYEWLEIIAQRGGDSPVIVVINKSDHDVPQRQIDEVMLCRTHPAIAGFRAYELQRRRHRGPQHRGAAHPDRCDDQRLGAAQARARSDPAVLASHQGSHRRAGAAALGVARSGLRPSV
ncbi:MAG: 50S ribosome-binding GTPase, partial [Myxococcales bacterium]|nr:50S ribosome-binding GTPase [Myxococcales bacterium]